MGFIHRAARLAEHAPWLANFFTRPHGVSALSKWIGGVHPNAEMPAFARRSFRRWFPDRAAPSAGGETTGKASCRERGCQYVSISVVAVAVSKKLEKYTTINKGTRPTHTKQ